MSSPVLSPPLRTLRRKWGLTQGDLARLMNLPNVAAISRFERGQRPLKFDALAAYAVVFGKTLAELDPRRFAEIEESVLRSAKELHTELRSDPTPRGVRKRELLVVIQKRAITRLNDERI